MSPLAAAVVPALPFAAAIALGLIGDRQSRGWPIGIWVNLAAAAATLLAALAFAVRPPASSSALLLADPLARHFTLLAAFIGFTAACAEFGRADEQGTPAQGPAWRPHLALVLSQAFLGAVLAALMTNSLVITVVAAEAASLALAVTAALSRTKDAMRAAWTRATTAGLAGGLALFGLTLLAIAAGPAQRPDAPALSWTTLPQAAAASQGALLSLGFACLLVGAAALAMAAPLRLWLAESGPTARAPTSAMTAPLMMTMAITMILRLRQAAADNQDAVVPGSTVLLLGLLALLIAALALGRQRDGQRFVAVATIGQGGIVAVAIGLGTSAAVFAGVLHLTLATLVLTALLSPAANRWRPGGPTGLGLTTTAGLIALAGLPPFGLFSSVLLIVTAAAHAAPLLLVPLGAGLGLGAWAMLARLPTPGPSGAAASRPESTPRATAWSRTMIVVPWLHLALTALLGLAMPIPLVRWFATIAGSLG